MATKKKTEEAPVQEIPGSQVLEVQDREVLTVVSGRELFAPVKFFTFEVGPITIETTVRENEAYEDAIERCNKLLESGMQAQFTEKMANFFSRMGQLDEFMENRGMPTRAEQDTFGQNSSRPAPRPQQQSNETSFPAEPVAASLSDLVTAKQLGMIRAVSRDANIDSEDECKRLLNCSTSELSKKAASSFIDHLMKMQRGGTRSAAVPMNRASEHTGPVEPAGFQRPATADDDIPF